MTHPLAGYRLRSGVLYEPTKAYLLAFDPKGEEEEEVFTYVTKWTAGAFGPLRKNFNAHTCCVVTKPEFAFVLVSGAGYYSYTSAQTRVNGNIFVESQPRPKEPRYGDIRWLVSIAGCAYAAGHEGSVYRLDGPKQWTRIDEGLPATFHIEAIDGFGPTDLYVVGEHGELWRSDGQRWMQRELPTNIHLSRVKCAGDGQVYVAGHRGVLLRGRDQTWSVIDHQVTSDDIWSLEWFEDMLYVATMNALFRLRGDVLEPVDFGGEKPKSFYHLSAVPGVMWSIGEDDVMSFDGSRWTRIV